MKKEVSETEKNEKVPNGKFFTFPVIINLILALIVVILIFSIRSPEGNRLYVFLFENNYNIGFYLPRLLSSYLLISGVYKSSANKNNLILGIACSFVVALLSGIAYGASIFGGLLMSTLIRWIIYSIVTLIVSLIAVKGLKKYSFASQMLVAVIVSLFILFVRIAV